ncbi:MAG: tetratricopeptide repeat protein, partial [Bacteroidota bacterium]
MEVAIATLYNRRNKFTASLQSLEKAKHYFEKTDCYPMKGIVYTKIGLVKSQLHHNHDEYNEYISKGADYFLERQDTVRAIRAYLIVENNYNLSKNVKLLTFYQKALALSKNQPPIALAKMHYKLGKAYRRNTNFYEADENFKNAIRLLEKSNIKSEQKFLHHIIYYRGHNLRSLQRPQEALELYEKVYAFNERTLKNRPVFQSEIEFKMASAYFKLGDLEKAIQLSKNAIEIRRKHLNEKSQWMTHRTESLLSEIYIQKGDLKKARNILSSLVLKRRKFNRPIDKVSTYRLLKTLAQKEGNLEEALIASDSALYHLNYQGKETEALLNRTVFLEVLSKRLSIYNDAFEKSNDPSYLKKGREELLECLYHFQKTLLSLNDANSKLDVYRIFYAFFDNSLNIYFHLFNQFPEDSSYFKEAVLIAEKSKDILLNEHIFKKKLKDDPTLADLFTEEKNLLKDVERLKSYQFELENNSLRNDEELNQVSTLLFDKNKSLNEISNSLKSHYTNFLKTDLDLTEFD